ncbi:hypothetical protein EH240_19815 [Mesorhizobium tamadayense]|uniref:Uncharacterized protein n=1 Tax=Mesorhizobium tamadayense TaxID=425306 RepID=A0A3P3FII3_9HYPH|nr:hypothetical protein [Mesorhizobium tamadayense]RRH98046.1 hypothetical protein EH240_19815 [Mesorhizobium tamadayense]
MRDAQSIIARMNAVRLKGPKAMWYAVAMDTLLDLFLKQETVSREGLKAEMARRMEKHADNELLRGSYEEAIAQLTDPISASVE